MDRPEWRVEDAVGQPLGVIPSEKAVRCLVVLEDVSGLERGAAAGGEVERDA